MPSPTWERFSGSRNQRLLSKIESPRKLAFELLPSLLVGTELTSLGRLAHRRPVLWESLALAVVCTLDMVSTLYLIRARIATESNPWMAITLERSDSAFLAVKTATFLIPIVVLELLRPVRPELVPRALRTCLLGYLVLYALGSLGLRIIG